MKIKFGYHSGRVASECDQLKWSTKIDLWMCLLRHSKTVLGRNHSLASLYILYFHLCHLKNGWHRGQRGESADSSQRDRDQVLGVPELLREEILRYVTAKLLAPVEETAKTRPTDKKDKLKFDSASSFSKGCIFMEICFVFRVNLPSSFYLVFQVLTGKESPWKSIHIFSQLKNAHPTAFPRGDRHWFRTEIECDT